MDLEQTRDVLLQALERQWQDNQKAVDTNRILADEKTAYENEARGTYYSGVPTWQRAQNAASAAEDLNKVNRNYADTRIKIWNSIQDTLDEIQAYNEAAGTISGIVGGPTSAGTTGNAPFIMNGRYYQYINGRLEQVG